MSSDLIDKVRRADDGPQKGRLVADLAVALMAGDPESLKAGYSFANALLAACEVGLVTSLARQALVAELMHKLLVEAYDRGELMGLG